MQRFIRVFAKDNIEAILGDREFIGEDWFQYLKDRGLCFYFRVRKDADTTNANGKSISIHWLFMNLPLNRPKQIKNPRKVYGHLLYITGMKIVDDYLIVVTNRKPEVGADDDVIKIYSIRWEIETLFGCLKTKGLSFEDTRITTRERVKKLIAVLAIAFCWAHLTGEWRNRCEKVIPLKKHGRPQVSLFRYGLDWIMTALIHRGQKLRKLVRIFTELIANPIRSLGLGRVHE